MKKTLIAFLAFLLTALAGFGQESKTYTPVRELVEQQGARTVRIRAAFSGVHDLSRLVFLVRDGDYIIPIRLLKKDLGAEKRFLDLHLQEGDMVAVEGVPGDITIASEHFTGLVDAVILDGTEVIDLDVEVIDLDQVEADVEEEEEEEDPATLPFNALDVKPTFQGGDANAFSIWVNSQLRYPENAKRNGIQGRVTLEFTIDTKGRVTDVKVLRGVHKLLDKEAVRVVSKSPRWTPGYVNQKPVRVTYTFPVIFQLR